MIIPPAPVQLGAVHLLPWCSGVSSRDNGVVLVHDDRAEIAAETGPLVGAAEGKVKEVLVAVRSHERRVVPGMVKNNPVCMIRLFSLMISPAGRLKIV